MDWLEALNRLLQPLIDFANEWIINIGPRIGGEQVAVMVILLLGTGVYLTIRTGFVQVTCLGHGFGARVEDTTTQTTQETYHTSRH